VANFLFTEVLMFCLKNAKNLGLHPKFFILSQTAR